MENSNSDKTIIFIKDNLELKEGYSLINHQFVDVLKFYELKDSLKNDNEKETLIKSILLKSNDLYQHADKIYLSIILDRFGSIFVGNSIRKKPIICVLKEIDPILYLIKIVYLACHYNNHNHSYVKESRGVDLIEIFSIYKSLYDELINNFYLKKNTNLSKNNKADSLTMNANRSTVYSLINYLSKLNEIEILLDKISDVEVDGK